MDAGDERILGILSGVDEIVDRHLCIEHIGTKPPRYVNKRAYIRLGNTGPSKAFTGTGLVGDVLARIEGNWRRRIRQQGPSNQNWRFEQHARIASTNASRETTLERAIVGAMPGSWANQVPTASGLYSTMSDRHRNLDLVHRVAPGKYEFIELKVDRDASTDTPLHAAMKLLQYGVLYIFSRLTYPMPDPLGREILAAKTVHLQILAPAGFYGSYRLDWLEVALTLGLARTIASHRHLSLVMDFAFTAFPPEFIWRCPDDALIAAINGRKPVAWGPNSQS